MARPKVIIADEDASYIVPLQFKFVTDFFNKILKLPIGKMG